MKCLKKTFYCGGRYRDGLRGFIHHYLDLFEESLYSHKSTVLGYESKQVLACISILIHNSSSSGQRESSDRTVDEKLVMKTNSNGIAYTICHQQGLLYKPKLGLEMIAVNKYGQKCHCLIVLLCWCVSVYTHSMELHAL